MQIFRRPVFALPSLFFGRGRRYLLEADRGPAVANDLKLFALTFAGGFLFMTVYLV